MNHLWVIQFDKKTQLMGQAKHFLKFLLVAYETTLLYWLWKGGEDGDLEHVKTKQILIGSL